MPLRGTIAKVMTPGQFNFDTECNITHMLGLKVLPSLSLYLTFWLIEFLTKLRLG